MPDDTSTTDETTSNVSGAPAGADDSAAPVKAARAPRKRVAKKAAPAASEPSAAPGAAAETPAEAPPVPVRATRSRARKVAPALAAPDAAPTDAAHTDAAPTDAAQTGAVPPAAGASGAVVSDAAPRGAASSEQGAASSEQQAAVEPAPVRTRAPRKRAAKKAAPPAAVAPAADAPDAEAAPAADVPATEAAPVEVASVDVASVEVASVEVASVEVASAEAPADEAPAPPKKATRTRRPRKAAPESAAEVETAQPADGAAPSAAGVPDDVQAVVVLDGAVASVDIPAESPAPDEPTDEEAIAEAVVEAAELIAELDAEDEEQPDGEAHSRDTLASLVPDVEADFELEAADGEPGEAAPDEAAGGDETEDEDRGGRDAAPSGSRRRRRGRRGRGGRRGEGDGDEAVADADAGESVATSAGAATSDEAIDAEGADDEGAAEDSDDSEGSSTRRRRKRRRRGGSNGSSSSDSSDSSDDDPADTVVHVRESRDPADEVRGIRGSTRLEAKRQRRRDNRDTGRKRTQILTEAEFLARRESVDRVMAVRQRGDRTQVAVLEDGILVEHYVTRASSTSYVGNIYLGRVQNVLPSMEAAFIDIGKGRNGVLYAGEVNWDAAGLIGKARAIEQALSSGDSVLVQVTKDPIGHKGARLTSQISLPGRFLVYVPGGGMTGISRKLPDTERSRLKAILKKIVPDDAGVIIRTAAEGASEEELTRDVERLRALWEQVQAAAGKPSSAPALVHGEPDLAIRVVRDVFNEDFSKLVVAGDGAWDTVSDYVHGVAPELAERVSRYTGDGDLFHDLRVDEQLAKALDRKVWLPSGGSLVIDRTEAMTVIDVNTGKFTGAGGNLEQTVTRNNLEAAEEIVRQLRLRDIGGIVVIDFIDMVLESNRDLVLRRLTECLGRDRTKHQVAEVTSLGLVQMTRKRVGEGLLEAFSEPCEHCHGRGVIVHTEPVFRQGGGDAEQDAPPSGKSGRRSRRNRGGESAPAAREEAPAVDPEARRKAASAMNAMALVPHEPADEEPEDPEAVQVEELVDALAPIEAPQPEILESVNGVHIAEPNGVEPSNVQPSTAATNGAEPNGAASSRPRRRRGASRPAGPPAHVEASAS